MVKSVCVPGCALVLGTLKKIKFKTHHSRIFFFCFTLMLTTHYHLSEGLIGVALVAPSLTLLTCAQESPVCPLFSGVALFIRGVAPQGSPKSLSGFQEGTSTYISHIVPMAHVCPSERCVSTACSAGRVRHWSCSWWSSLPWRVEAVVGSSWWSSLPNLQLGSPL